MRPRDSRGGQANEAGSLHRSGVAAYLAAHGLAGRGVEAAGYLEKGPAPVTLAFETEQAVDDIRCGLADETVLDLQAKRACGADKSLTATVAQWAEQAGQLRPGDKIGLVTAEPKGPSGPSALPSAAADSMFLAGSRLARRKPWPLSRNGYQPVWRSRRPNTCWMLRL